MNIVHKLLLAEADREQHAAEMIFQLVGESQIFRLSKVGKGGQQFRENTPGKLIGELLDLIFLEMILP
jgi:hypothetical protein